MFVIDVIQFLKALEDITNTSRVGVFLPINYIDNGEYFFSSYYH
jgi:hypothetical protein